MNLWFDIILWHKLDQFIHQSINWSIKQSFSLSKELWIHESSFWSVSSKPISVANYHNHILLSVDHPMNQMSRQLNKQLMENKLPKFATAWVNQYLWKVNNCTDKWTVKCGNNPWPLKVFPSTVTDISVCFIVGIHQVKRDSKP